MNFSWRSSCVAVCVRVYIGYLLPTRNLPFPFAYVVLACGILYAIYILCIIGTCLGGTDERMDDDEQSRLHRFLAAIWSRVGFSPSCCPQTMTSLLPLERRCWQVLVQWLDQNKLFQRRVTKGKNYFTNCYSIPLKSIVMLILIFLSCYWVGQITACC
jgi:hypothetical protein